MTLDRSSCEWEEHREVEDEWPDSLNEARRAGEVGTPKSGTGWDVHLSQHLADRLARLRATPATAALRQGSGENRRGSSARAPVSRSIPA